MPSPSSKENHDSNDRGNTGYFERVGNVSQVAGNTVPVSATMPVEPLNDVMVPHSDKAVLEDVGN